MKKLTINLFAILLITMIFACGSKTDKNNNETNNNVETEDVKKDNNVEEKIDFSKFDHYATILSKEDLTMKFGESDLTDETKFFAEGTVKVETTTLVNSKFGHTITFGWNEDNSKTAWISADYTTLSKAGFQEIKTNSGLSTGMTLSELQKWNGAEFKFSGFGWDYGGGIFQEEGSKITNSPITIDLGLLDYAGFDFALGDIELVSSDAKLKDAKIVVTKLKLYID